MQKWAILCRFTSGHFVGDLITDILDDPIAPITGTLAASIKYSLTGVKTYVTLQNKAAQDSRKFLASGE